MKALPLALTLLLAAPAAFAEDVPIPEKIPSPPSEETAPTVSIRTEANGDVVAEYRIQGQLRMVRVQPQRGPTYYLVDSNGDGRLDSSKGEGPISPVYYKIYGW